MQHIFYFFVFSLLCQYGFAQNDSCKHNDDPILVLCESQQLNKCLTGFRGDFDFTGKKILVAGNTDASKIISKSQFFEFIKLHLDNCDGVTGIVQLAPKEKERSGGYDAIILYYVESFDKARKARLVDEASKIK